MPIELSHLHQLITGKRHPLTVGDLPRRVAEHMGCHPAVVYLGRKELFHILETHQNDISLDHVQQFHLAIRDGRYVANPKTNRRVDLFYRATPDDRPYLIGIKSAERGGEVWIASAYRTNEQQERSRANRALVLQDYIFR